MFIIFVSVMKRRRITLAMYREKAPLVWKIGDNTDMKISMYRHPEDGVRTDFTFVNTKKSSCLSLTDDQLCTLNFISSKVDEAVRKFTPVTYELGEEVVLTYSKFRGEWLINIRQFYVDDKGDRQPTRWGVVFKHLTWRQYRSKTASEVCKYSFTDFSVFKYSN